MEFKVGDKCYYVEPETDSEVECYVYKVINENNIQVKIRDKKSYGVFPNYRLTKIDPPNWETLEENLQDCGFDPIIGEKVEEIIMKSKDQLKDNSEIPEKTATGVVINVQ